MNYYRKQQRQPTTLTVNDSYQGETIENKIRRITNNKEPITDGAPLIYTERGNGVEAQYNIRTDRFEIAVEAMDTVSKSHTAKRDQRIGERTYDTMTPEQQTKFNTDYPNNKHAKAIAQQKQNEGKA